LVINSNFYKSSWDDTLLITLLLVTIRALAKLTNKFLILSGQSRDGLYVLSESSATSVPEAFLSTSMFSTADVWHRRLGHPSSRILGSLVSNNKVACTSRVFNFSCSSCPLGKASRMSLGLTGHKTCAPLELIFSDVWGPSPMLSTDGYRYFVIFMDAYTKYIWFFPLAAKSDVFKIFLQFQALVELQFDTKIKFVQTDWGGEYRKLNTYFKTIGIHHRLICPHTHEQNGTVERRHRHIVETGLTLLGQCKAPLKFWSYAFETAVYLINRMPTVVLNGSTPFERLFKSSPDYNFLRIFWCLCFPLLRPYNRHKLDFRSTPCVFLGYSSFHLGYHCFDLSTSRMYIARQVKFHENTFPFACSEQTTSLPSSSLQTALPALTFFPTPMTTPSTPSLPLSPTPAHRVVASPPSPCPVNNSPSPSSPLYSATDHSPSMVSVSPGTVIPLSADSSPVVSPSRPPSSPTSSPSSGSSPGLHLVVDLSNFDLQQVSHSPSLLPANSSRSHHMTLRPRQPKQAHLSVSQSSAPVRSAQSPASVCSASPEHEPLTFKDATQHSAWQQAMQDEIRALQSNGTWTLVPYCSSMNVVGSRWVYKIKRRADGSIDRYKARLVARGFTQQEGINYLETFSPVVKPATVRLVLTIVVSRGWFIHQLDVHNAFLNGILLEEVYMEQPPGFSHPTLPSHVCHLHKSIYGLKQAPRAWYTRLSDYLISLGFRASNADPSLFIYSDGHDLIYLLVYVDDLLLTGNNSTLLRHLITLLNSEFKIRDLGFVHYFLGIEVTKTAMGLMLSQHKYALDIIQRAGMS